MKKQIIKIKGKYGTKEVDLWELIEVYIEACYFGGKMEIGEFEVFLNEEEVEKPLQ